MIDVLRRQMRNETVRSHEASDSTFPGLKAIYKISQHSLNKEARKFFCNQPHAQWDTSQCMTTLNVQGKTGLLMII